VVDTLKPANDAVEGVVTQLVPVVEPVVDVVAPVVDGIAAETMLPPIGVLVPRSGDAGPSTALPPAGEPRSSGAATVDDSHAAKLADTVPGSMAAPGPVSGLPALAPSHPTTGSLSAPFAGLAASGLPLGPPAPAAGATSGASSGGDTVGLRAVLPIQSAGTWLLPAADAFSSLPHPAYEIPVSPA
jgi:hypothetical protein